MATLRPNPAHTCHGSGDMDPREHCQGCQERAPLFLGATAELKDRGPR